MTTLDLRTLRLRPGEVRREILDVEVDPFVLGGQRYESTTATIPVELEISQASGATVFDLRLRAHLSGACMRCLGFAELEREVAAREFHDPDAPAGDELRSDYVVSDQLQVSTWARDAIALELPDQMRADLAVCPPERRGLFPAVTEAQRHRHHACDHREARHQDRTQP